VNLIVGRAVTQLYHRAERKGGSLSLTVSGLIGPGVGPVSFTARAGEVLGLVGLRGAGQETVGRCLFGAETFSGKVERDGKVLDLSSTVAALDQGIGLVARDRTEESVALSLSVRENIFLNPSAVGRKLLSVLSPALEAMRAIAVGKSVGLRPNDPHLPVEALSGGNQQKVVVGRWLATNRCVLIAEDPTAGVDVGAKSEIYQLISKALQSGLTVIIVSTDFEEVAHICHRALVFSRGSIVAEIEGTALTTQSLIHAASASEAA
jgi:ribose transport system ATP-binding protein